MVGPVAGTARLALLLGAWVAQQRGALLAQEGARLQAQVHQVASPIAGQLASTHQILGLLADRWRDREAGADAAAGDRWLQALADIHVGVRTLVVIDARGRVVAANRASLVGRDVTQREFFQTARHLDDPAALIVSPPYVTSLDVYAMNASRVLHDAQGRFDGMVTATLDPEFFRRALDAALFAPDAWAALAHDSGVLVMRQPPLPGSEGQRLDRPGSMFERHAASGAERTLFVGPIALTGDADLIAQQTVRPPGAATAAGLVIALARSEAAALAPWRRVSAAAAALLVLLAVVAAAGLHWVQRAERVAALGLDRLERIGRTAPGVICQFRLDADGRTALPFATRPLQPWFGVAASDRPGSADALFAHVDAGHVEAVRQAVLASARTLEPLRCEFPIRVPGGPARWLEVHGLPQRLADGGTLWTGIAIEATAQHEAREARLALVAAQRANRAKSEFLSRVSHELRTPLNAVIGFTTLLLNDRDGALNERQRTQLGHVLDAGEHLLALINDLLDITLIESGRVRAEIDDVPLAPLLAEVAATVDPAARAAGVRLQADVPAPALAVRADRVRLKQVLLNLLSNAIKFNHRGGTVELSAAAAADGRVAIEVRDTGAGLSPAQREHLFEPFNRLGAEQRGIAGTGIGLALAKVLVERMHGRLGVDSKVGVGSRFVVQLPAATCSADAIAAATVH
jgi:signal transduction histidine kinase